MKSKKKIENIKINELQDVVKKALHKLNTMDTTVSPQPKVTSSSKSADELFGELVVKLLGEIPEQEEKALLKIEIQQKFIRLKHLRVQQSPMDNRLRSLMLILTLLEELICVTSHTN